MGRASDNVFPKVKFAMQTANQAAPSDSSWTTYAKADGIYARSSNAVVGPFGAASGGAGSYSGASVTNSGTQSVNSATATTLTFDTEDYDTDSYHSTSVNTGRMTVGATKKYRFTASFRFSAGFANEGHLWFQKNGTTGLANAIGGLSLPASTVSNFFCASIELSLTNADFVTVEVYQDSGSARNVSQQRFSVTKLDP